MSSPGPATALAADTNEPLPVLFDTDIGSDIDDAVALGYLLAQPRCDLLGITTATGDTQKRAALASAICQAGNRPDVPIFAGLTGPLLHGPGQPHVPQYPAIADLPHETTFPGGADAVLFLRDTIRARPGQVTLLAVGPMTNVAALFALDPEIPGLLKSLVLMCGVFTAGGGQGPGAREWNALVDPVASALVYHQAGQAGPGKLVSVGLEVTTRCKLPRDECRERFARAGGGLGVVGAMAEVWFKHVPNITFHDPLAATLLFAPDLCRYAAGRVDVFSNDGPLAGLTRWTPEKDIKKAQAKSATPPKTDPAPHTIAVDVNPDAFFAHYFGVVEP